MPVGAKVVRASGEKVQGTSRIVGEPLLVKLAHGEGFVIGGVVIFDAKVAGTVAQELYAQSLEQVVVVDSAARRLSVGFEVSGLYLNQPDRVYPVTIDPTYYACQEGYNGAYALTCFSLTDLYFRQLNGLNQTNYTSEITLFTGYSDDDEK